MENTETGRVVALRVAICFLTSIACAQTPQQLPAPSPLIAAGCRGQSGNHATP